MGKSSIQILKEAVLDEVTTLHDIPFCFASAFVTGTLFYDFETATS